MDVTYRDKFGLKLGLFCHFQRGRQHHLRRSGGQRTRWVRWKGSRGHANRHI